MSFVASQELSLCGAVVDALRIAYTIVRKGFDLHSEVSDLTVADTVKTLTTICELDSLYQKLEPPQSVLSSYDGPSRALLEQVFKTRRIVGDLMVHIESAQREEAQCKDWSELRYRLSKIWTREDFNALERRILVLNDLMFDAVIPALKKNLKLDETGPYAQSNKQKDSQLDTMLQIFSSDAKLSMQRLTSPVTAIGERAGTISDERTDDTNATKGQGSGLITDNEEHDLRDHTKVVEDFILDSLAFSAMKDREEEVVEAHGKTLDWLFCEMGSELASKDSGAVVHFPTWLRGNENIYWVNGKAGSGKSTLMRFIVSHQKTFEELQIWAGGKQLTTAGFYFWTSGSLEQRSQVGLLRYLLYQLLQEHRHLIGVTLPSIWNIYLHSSTKDRISARITWELPQLVEGFKLFLHHALRTVKICLFVDGLDEFDGDHGMIIDFFKGLLSISNANLKLCLSSRPWPVFEKAFQNFPTLRLQDLTFQDMVHYINDKFRKHECALVMLRTEPLDSKALIREIVFRADGVFLWVALVIRSLLEHFHEGDNVAEVRRRLLRLPTSLNQLFQHTLFDIQTDSTLEDTSRIFQLIRARESVCDFTGDMTAASLTLWELALALTRDLEQTFETEIHKGSKEETIERCLCAKALIERCCAGLLGINENTRENHREVDLMSRNISTTDVRTIRSKVTYLHRTVRDWLLQTNAWASLLRYTDKSHYDPHIGHIMSFILQLKLALDEPVKHRNLDEWWPGIILTMTHARLSNRDSVHMQTRLINEFNSTLDLYWASRRGDTWARSTFGSYEKRNRAVIDNPFLALTTKFGLAEYVKTELENKSANGDGLEDAGGKPLLSYALEFLINRQLTVYPLSDPSLVSTILSHGGDSNKAYMTLAQGEETPWLAALKHVRDANRRRWIDYYDLEDMGIVRWVGILKMLVKARADPNAVIVETKWDPEATALEVVETVLERFKSREMKELRDMLINYGARRR